MNDFRTWINGDFTFFTPRDIISFCQERIAAFKIPRYIEYRKEFAMTPSGKIQKHLLLTEKENLTADCYDRLKDEGE